MLLGANPTLDQHIITSLTESGNLNVTDMLHTIHERGLQVSIQGLYKALKKLQSDGILNKNGKFYSLKLSWILDLSEFVEQLETVYFKKDFLSQLIPNSIGEKKRWHFYNVLKLIDIWIDIQLALLAHTKADIIYSYAPHPWYAIAKLDDWTKYKKLLNKRVLHQFSIFGEKTYLDQYLNAIIQDPNKETVHFDQYDEFPEKLTNIYTNIIGDYVISIKLHKELVNKLQDLFSTVTDEADIHLFELFDVFTKKARSSIQIKKDPVFAQKYRKRFTKIFGPTKIYTEKK